MKTKKILVLVFLFISFLAVNPKLSFCEKAKDLPTVTNESINNARSLKQEIEAINNSLHCQSLSKTKAAYKTLHSKFNQYDKGLTDLLQILINLQGLSQKVDGLSNGLLLLTVRNSISSDLDFLRNNIISIELSTLFRKQLLLAFLLIALVVYLAIRKR